MKQKIIKGLLLLHRYFGLVLSLLFVVWFLSGFVMMYTKYPYLKKDKNLEQSSLLNSNKSCLLPQAAFLNLKTKDTLEQVNIGSLLNKVVYHFYFKDGTIKTVYAADGSILKPIDSSTAKTIAQHFVKKPIVIKETELLENLDQWTPRNSFKPHLPMYKFTLDDAAGNLLYVSSKTGEVVQMLTANERFWAWLGPIPHWIYYRDLIVNRPLWRQVIIWTSSLGVVLSITGIILGFVRIRKNKKGKKNTITNFSPYKKRWFKWHHYTGFAFGFFIFTWILSGLLSMNPWKWSPDSDLNEEESLSWTGGSLNLNAFVLSPDKALRQSKLKGVKEIQLIQFKSTPYYLVSKNSKETELINASDSVTSKKPPLTIAKITQAIQDLNPNLRLKEIVVLNEYDHYYYDKNNVKALPVVRIKRDDENETWFYINPKTSKVIYKLENASRLERWLYNGLHSWDFPFLYKKRPLWDVLMILFLLGGLAVSFTGLILTLKWVKRKI